VGQWLARVYYPYGQVRYANYSTVVEALVSGLYDDFLPPGETDDFGFVSWDRGKVKGDPSPVDLSKSLSEPDEIILVRIEVEPDRITWPALYCPRRNQIVGPLSKYNADAVQHAFKLIRQNDRLHLVPEAPYSPITKPTAGGRGLLSFLRILCAGETKIQLDDTKPEVNGADWTLCGEPAVGEEIPFLQYYLMGHSREFPQPTDRDLYAEWSDGLVCRRCLLHRQALRAWKR
jgi:hypothetical protein